MLKASKWKLSTIHFNYSDDTDESDDSGDSDDSDDSDNSDDSGDSDDSVSAYFEFKLALNILCLGVCTSMAPSIGQFTMGKKKRIS